MSKFPEISIITACYNAEKTIEQTIQSVVNQTYDNLEYIIVDGASTDRTMEIVNKYKDYIDIIISEPDNGIYDAFNKGIKAATGDYINFMNADDYFSNNNVIKEVTASIDKDIKMIYGKVRAIDESSGEWHYRGHQLQLNDLKLGDMFPHQGAFVSRDLFLEYNFFDTKYKMLADVDFSIKCFKKHEQSTKFLNTIIADFRLGGMSSNHKYLNVFHEENKAIHLEHFNFVPQYTVNYFNNLNLITSDQYYKQWLKLKILNSPQYCKRFNFYGERIGIFGTKQLSVMMYHELCSFNNQLTCFIDNNIDLQGELLNALPIVPMTDLHNLDTIIICVERFNAANELRDMIVKKFPNLKCLTWFDLIDEASN